MMNLLAVSLLCSYLYTRSTLCDFCLTPTHPRTHTHTHTHAHTHTQSSGPQKPQKNKKSSKGKKNEPSNPKHKYRQKDKGQPQTVEQSHRQKGPLLLTVDESHSSVQEEQAINQQDGDTVDGSPSEEPSESTVSRTIPSEDKETEVETEEQTHVESLSDEVPPVDDIPVLDTSKVGDDFKEIEEGTIEEDVKVQDGGHESDEEEKRAILAEENILTLEEAEKVQKTWEQQI